MTHLFRVWAPNAQQVDLALYPHGVDSAPTFIPMSPATTPRDGTEEDAPRSSDASRASAASGAGWWHVQADPGTGRYAYRIDGSDPRPDPRSRHQPDGVHAPSALVDTDEFVWSDESWRGIELQDAVIYEVHVGTFSPEGTFAGVIDRLDHLVDLGVTVIELMPVAAFPGQRGWGYDGVNLFAVHEAYGGPAGLAALVDAAHARGLAVWLDVVHNHLGPSGNYLSQFGPYFTDAHHTPWGEAINLDGPHSDEVRAFLLDNVAMWLRDYHLDGLRLDAVHELHDRRAMTWLEEAAALADEISFSTGIPKHLIAESDRNDPATVTPRGVGGAGGLGLHGQWADDVHHGLHVALTGETQGYYADFAPASVLPRLLSASPFLHDGTYSSFRGRIHGRPVDPAITPGFRYVVSLQTHDQVGNRAVGDRLSHLAGVDRAAVGAALLLTSPYTPMLFMGEEWAASTPWQYFTDHAEDWLAEAIRAGRAAEFADHGWGEAVPDPQDPGTAVASTLRWDEAERGEHAAMLAWYRTLLRLRRELPGLRDTPLAAGSVQRLGSLLVVRRGEVTVIARLGEGRSGVVVDGPAGGSADEFTLPGPVRVQAQWGDALLVQDNPAHVRLAGDAVMIVTQESG